MTGHVCGVCSRYDFEHDSLCYAGEPDSVLHPSTISPTGYSVEHSPFYFHLPHLPPLCCPGCLCLSYEEAHPDAVGTSLESLPGNLQYWALLKRVLTILRHHGVYTVERLEANQHSVPYVQGLGPKSRKQIFSLLYQWRNEISEARVERRPLPEDIPEGAL